jgi:UDP-perosamine 4-acetyltransferase
MTSAAPTKLPLIILGSGGHAKVLLALVRTAGLQIQGVCAPELAGSAGQEWRGITVLGGDEALDRFDPPAIGLVNGVGQLVGSLARRRLFERLSTRGFCFPALIHPAAWIDQSVQLEQGVQVMAGAIIQPDTRLGTATIVNTGASVDHDCRIGAHVHIAPGATLCGGVTVCDGAFVASGATILPGCTVGEGAVVGAGAVLTRDLAPGRVLLGQSPRLKP